MGGGCIDTGCASRTLGRILGRGMKSRKRGGFGAACAMVVIFLAVSQSTRASEPPAPGAQQPVEAAEWVRQGMAAVAEGREAEARARFQRLAAEYPLMADYAEYWLAQSLLREQRHEAAANVLARARGAHPESRLAFAFAVQEGDLKAALGDEDGARVAWRAASGSLPRGSSQRAPLWLAVADSFARAKDREAAHRAYRDTWSVYPLEPEGERAAEWLAVAAAQGVPVRAMNYLLFGMLILALVTSLQAVGCVLSVGLLVAPAATLSLLTNRTSLLFWGGGLVGALGSVFALLLAYWTDIPAGPAIVIVLGTLFLLAFLLSPKYGLLPRIRTS